LLIVKQNYGKATDLINNRETTYYLYYLPYLKASRPALRFGVSGL